MLDATRGFKPLFVRRLHTMTAAGGIWLALVTAAAAWGFALGVPFWLSATAFVCAVVPPLAGMFMRGSTSEAQAVEVESGLWIALATAGAASTGGATALIVIFGVAIAIAWVSGRARLTLEIAAFSLFGLVISIIAGSGGSWMHSHDAAILATGYGVAGMILLGSVSVLAALRRHAASSARGGTARGEADAARRLTQMETRLRMSAIAAQEARVAADAAREQLEKRTTFFAQTSHELRTPLNAIIGFADMMRNGVFGPLPERYQEYAELIHEGGRNLNLIVDDVLDLARLEAGRYEIQRELTSLADLADEAVRFMSDEATRKRIDLVRVGEEDAEAFADPKAVRQIALNLISNALKFTPEGGSVEVMAVETEGGAELSVLDTGVGITPDELTRLSRAFEQGEAGRKQKGAGLGLSVVRAFAELHGGRLEIASREDGGTRITVFFPAEAPGDSSDFTADDLL
jgi:signal transduction histidine kinase